MSNATTFRFIFSSYQKTVSVFASTLEEACEKFEKVMGFAIDHSNYSFLQMEEVRHETLERKDK